MHHVNFDETFPVGRQFPFLHSFCSTSCNFYISVDVDHRLKKSLDTSSLFAVEMHDLCTIPPIGITVETVPNHTFPGSTFAIEIKVIFSLIQLNR